MPREDLHVQGLPHGGREVREASSVHGLQAGSHNEDDQLHSLRAEASGLHGNPLRAESNLQASTGDCMLPGSLLPEQLRLQLRVTIRMDTL
jgi:hypothetical protein